ncbi:hypothetical protein [Nocardia terpenica]|uniref:Uncharacterized protein n=1 Tax=Nocardia terpenica TaxID=455432 RepID=A0A164HVI5_9NOCA|nr:hypothetical protein [Nocardia terpenica]KZM68856.1 hypothetical protein AWN90_13790 [Nocardia terpenica]NQE88100.1 hypothetical protein [Nocardia terpenica]
MSTVEILRSDVDTFLDAWASGYLASDIGEKLCCGEVEALAHLMIGLGRLDAAENWIAFHAEGDDCGDQHCRCAGDHCANPEESLYQEGKE